jgi:hypothetical protein
MVGKNTVKTKKSVLVWLCRDWNAFSINPESRVATIRFLFLHKYSDKIHKILHIPDMVCVSVTLCPSKKCVITFRLRNTPATVWWMYWWAQMGTEYNNWASHSQKWPAFTAKINLAIAGNMRWFRNAATNSGNYCIHNNKSEKEFKLPHQPPIPYTEEGAFARSCKVILKNPI